MEYMFSPKANLELTPNKMTVKYYEIVNRDIANTIDNINIAVRNRKLAIAMICKYADKVIPNKLLSYCKDVNNNVKKYEYKIMYKSFNSVRKDFDARLDILLPKYNNTEVASIVYTYYNSLYDNIVEEHNLGIKLKQLETILEVNGKTIRHISKTYFKYVAEKILRGYRYTIFDTVTLLIYGTSRIKNKEKFGRQIAKVSWRDSINTLVAISDELGLDFGQQYVNKTISKNQLIKSMKPYTYSDDNPKGKKWLVYDNKNFDFWLTKRNINSNLPNISNYHIVPTNYIMNETKSQIDFTNNCTHVNDIITSNLLGMRDKIKALERFDVDYCLETFNNNIETI